MSSHAETIGRPVDVAVDATKVQLDPVDRERSDAAACCDPSELESCCEPAAKVDCCGPSTAGGCGCR